MPPTSHMKGRRNALWPMPSGSGNYFEALRHIVTSAAGGAPVQEAVGQLQDQYQIANVRTARSYVSVAETLGLVVVSRGDLKLTPLGRRANRGGTQSAVREGLLTNVNGCTEIVAHLRRTGASLPELRSALAQAGIRWQGASQVRYRLRWMEEAGIIERHGQSRGTWYSLVMSQTRRSETLLEH